MLTLAQHEVERYAVMPKFPAPSLAQASTEMPAVMPKFPEIALGQAGTVMHVLMPHFPVPSLDGAKFAPGRLSGIGQDELETEMHSGVRAAWWILSTASMAASAFHGYRRNQSVGWALWWGLMGGLFPVITPTIALAQGFAQPK